MSDKSVISGLSGRSRSSHSCKVDAAADVAALKVKLNYVDQEASKRAELVKLETQIELDMAQARLSAIEQVECEETIHYGKYNHEQLTHDDCATNSQNVNDYVQNYVQSIETPLNTAQVVNSTVQLDTPMIQRRNNIHDRHDTGMDPSPGFIASTRLDGSAKEFIPQYQYRPIDYSVDFANMTKSFAQQISLNRLPPPEPGTFYGDPLMYPSWKKAFDTLIDGRDIPPSESIYYLKRYLGGAAKEAVEGYFLLMTDSAYDEAKHLLDDRYGNPFEISTAFRKKLDSWPKIAGRDGLALRKYGDFLKQCLTAMVTIDSLAVLNDIKENQNMIAKLPEWLGYRWGRIVSDWKEKRKSFPPFEQFVKFVTKEADIACEPVIVSLSNVQARDRAGRSGFRDRDSERKTSLITGVSKKCCLMCSREHDIDTCELFCAKSLSDRKEIAMKKRLCFGCLKIGHISRDCPKRTKCRTCSFYHPTAFHGDMFPRRAWTPAEYTGTGTGSANGSSSGTENKPDITRSSQDNSASTQVKPAVAHASAHTGQSDKCSMIVPVWLSHCDNPENERLVYALLDTQSDTTFVLRDTSDALNVKGPSVKLRLSTMTSEDELVDSCKIGGLRVRGFDRELQIPLPVAYSRDIMPANKDHIPTPDKVASWPHLSHLANELMPLRDIEVGVLIGYDCSRALTPREVIAPLDGNEPYGQRTDLGWGVVGIINHDQIDSCDSIGLSHRILTCEVPDELCISTAIMDGPRKVHISQKVTVQEVVTPHDVACMMELDFNERKSTDVPVSFDDKNFLAKMKDGIHQREDKHYEMPLPFRETEPDLTNNREMAMQRLMQLKRRLTRNSEYASDYCSFMQNMIEKGHMEKVPVYDVTSAWYIPHHGVYNPQKPGKIRVVFDCSAQHEGVSLNDHLLKGPDLTNTMGGVLCRFRKETIAIQCDIEQMFLQFHVDEDHRRYLQLLWWENNNFDSEPIDYRMTVHLFGAASSPGCANFGLKQVANDYECKHGLEAANFVRKSFYVDDGLTSVATVNEAVSLIQKSKELCGEGALRLHKFVSNSKEVLATIPSEDCAKGIKDIDIMCDSLPVERVLGVNWCIESDAFQFRITLNDQPLVRRSVLSTINSIYDPLGFIAPVLLVGKQILQETCKEKLDWDDPLPDRLRVKWEKWRSDLCGLDTLEIPRCFKPIEFGDVKAVELHHFSDASTSGYGQASYLRFVDEDDRVHCSFVMGKARIAPMKSMTIPRLELAAAVVSVRISEFLQRELCYENIAEVFWSDSKVVLGYIANDSKRFHIFVANRVQQIRDHSEPSQWRYVRSEENAADAASRGLSVDEFQQSRWLLGPEFLWNREIPTDDSKCEISLDDPEVRRVKSMIANTQEVNDVKVLALEHVAKWDRAKRAIARCLKLKTKLVKRLAQLSDAEQPCESVFDSIRASDLHEAECEIVKCVQSDVFREELKVLESINDSKVMENPVREVEVARKKVLKGASAVSKLDPFIDEKGVMCVGGRIRHSEFSDELKHPMILPRKHHITTLVIRHFHERVGHQGRGMTMNEIRSNGFWIIGCGSAVSYYVSKCVTCRKLRSSLQGQKMADLPADRMKEAPPFSYCGVDMFGPFYIKEGRRELKRYGALFTCLVCRAVHIETTNSLSTDSFINALRRFIAVRGPIRHLRCDQGTNFVGAMREFKQLNSDAVKDFLMSENCDFIMNVPSASHMGGVWERQIRTVRSVLVTLMDQAKGQLDEEGLRTLMYEVMAIVNSRPLTVDTSNDPTSLEPLTPNHLLTSKSKIILPPPGTFQKTDVYCRKMWRRVQHLSNEFWQRWKREYLQTLQVRQKWLRPRRVACVGDIVLLKDDNLPRNLWRLGRICEVYANDDNLVRKVKLVLGEQSFTATGKRTFLDRPIHKLVLLLESEDVEQ